MKYIITSKTSNENYLIDDEKNDFQKEFVQFIQSSIDGPFSIRPFVKDDDHAELWAIYLNKVQAHKLPTL